MLTFINTWRCQICSHEINRKQPLSSPCRSLPPILITKSNRPLYTPRMCSYSIQNVQTNGVRGRAIHFILSTTVYFVALIDFQHPCSNTIHIHGTRVALNTWNIYMEQELQPKLKICFVASTTKSILCHESVALFVPSQHH